LQLEFSRLQGTDEQHNDESIMEFSFHRVDILT